MRIAIIGNSGTGKTMLATELARELEFPLVPEFAREIMAEWNLTMIRGLPIETMVCLQEEILRRKLAAEQQLSRFVADRSTADSAVIWLVRLAGAVPPELCSEMVERCRVGMGAYDHVFLLPDGVIALEDDGVRQLDWGRRFLFTIALRGLLDIWGCRYHVVRSIPLSNRVEEVADIVLQRPTT